MIMQRWMLLVVLFFLMPMNASAGNHFWSQRFGDFDEDWGLAVAVDGSGNVFISGAFVGAVDFGGGVLTSAGYRDIFLAKYDVNGGHIWSRHFGDFDEDFSFAVAVDASDNVLVTGAFNGTVDFGGGPLVSAGGRDIFLAKYDVSGNHIWSLRSGTALSDGCHDIAVDDTGSVFLTGWYDAGDYLEGTDCIFLAKYDSAGNEVWSKLFSDPSEDAGLGVTVDGANNVIMTGIFKNSMDFGGGVLTSAGGEDIFLVKYSPAGTHIWSQRFGAIGNDQGRQVGVDGSDNVYLTGVFRFTVDFGGGPLISAGTEDVFVARYDAAGNHVWSQRFGGSGSDWGYSIAIDEESNVLVAGRFSDTVIFGGEPLISAGSDDIFVAKYDASGNHIWSQRFGDTSGDWGYGIAVDAADNVLVTGVFNGTVDFGGEPLTSAGGWDIFLAKFGPTYTGIVDSPHRQGIAAYSYPNPFNPRTTIAITLPEKGHVTLRIYDINGRVVTTLHDGVMSQGLKEVTWDGKNSRGTTMSSGVYFYRLMAGDYTLTKKMVLLK